MARWLCLLAGVLACTTAGVARLSVAQVERLVMQRSTLREAREFQLADQIKLQLEDNGVKLQDEINGHTSWAWAPPPPPQPGAVLHVLELARSALHASGSATAAADSAERVAKLAAEARKCCQSRETPPLLGRAAADAAFDFALAGARDSELFELLAKQQASEYARWRHPQPLATLQTAERLVAAGVLPPHGVYEAAAEALDGEQGGAAAAAVRALRYGDARPSRWLWRRAVRRRKRTVDSSGAPPMPPSSGSIEVAGAADRTARLSRVDCEAALAAVRFGDPTLPLIVDVGCGYGHAMLSLVARSPAPTLNVLGCDADASKIAYASGLAARWARDGEAAFVTAGASETMDWTASHYPGPVYGVCLLFPTPFGVVGSSSKTDRNRDGEGRSGMHATGMPAAVGNRQLPSSAEDASYMANRRLVRQIADALRANVGAWLYVASNVEDVAVHARAAAEAEGLSADGTPPTSDLLESSSIPSPAPFVGAVADATGGGATAATSTAAAANQVAPGELRRNRLREATGHAPPRAVGAGWLERSPLGAISETEAMLELEGRPIYRTVLRSRAP
jgi:SAM-dependent methyltransferase